MVTHRHLHGGIEGERKKKKDGKEEILGVGWGDPSEQVPREQGSPQGAGEVGLEFKPV